jgi:hypothetical protein
MSQAFITMVAKMRDAQRAARDEPTRANLKICEDLEYKVDAYILKNIAEQINFMNWIEQVRTDEEPGAYNVGHDGEEEKSAAT